jgi:uncharacterized protein YutE (UPF0331/DUF86 family)
MTDPELLEKKLAFIETCVSELHRLAQPELIETDVREERFVAHTLQLAIQAAIDIASHIVSDQRLGEPETDRDLFRITGHWIDLPEGLTDTLQKMAGFRNILVHGYQTVDRRILRDVLEHHMQDLLDFVALVRAKPCT